MHLYLDKQLMTPDHPRWGKLDGWKLTKKGQPTKRPGSDFLMEAGCLPSVTTILGGVGDKGGLLHWYKNIGIQAAIETFGTDDDWTGAAKKRAYELSLQAANRGTEMHNAIEYGIAQHADPALNHAIHQVKEWLKKHGFEGGKKEWVVESKLFGGFAGTVDYVLEDQKVVLDYKTSKGGRAPRPSDCAQLASYALAIFGTTQGVTCINVYLDADTGDITGTRHWSQPELAWGWSMMQAACQVWRLDREWKGVENE